MSDEARKRVEFSVQPELEILAGLTVGLAGAVMFGAAFLILGELFGAFEAPVLEAIFQSR
jgi:hypothetical protein